MPFPETNLAKYCIENGYLKEGLVLKTFPSHFYAQCFDTKGQRQDRKCAEDFSLPDKTPFSSGSDRMGGKEFKFRIILSLAVYCTFCGIKRNGKYPFECNYIFVRFRKSY